MGIQGLLPLLKDIQSKTSMSNFKGQTVGVDAYCWLHKGVYGCAKDVVMGQKTDVYIHYVLRRVRMMLSHSVTPILVFDGGHLPAKLDKEKERRAKRKEYKEKAMNALREGNNQAAFENFQKCCDITPQMASEVIEACTKLNVTCIVAPYEADAQLAYLMKSGVTQLTISEDSDLLLYGCTRVLYKMSAEGDGMLVDTVNLPKVRSVALSSFTLDTFRHMCMLSGCDYLPSIKGMGLKKAHQALKRHSSVHMCIRAFKCNPQYTVPASYEEDFRKAELVFKYQLVFDHRTNRIVPLNEPMKEMCQQDRDYCGPKLDNAMALQIALGNVDPIGKTRLASRKDFASGVTKSVPPAKISTGWLSSKPSDSGRAGTMDLTPPNSQAVNKDVARNLQNTLNKVLEVKAEASQSLKRLRNDDEAGIDDRDRWKQLYEKTDQNVKPKQHHSVFTKRKCVHKFKNPFRTDDAPTEDGESKTAFSRYFKGSQTSQDSKTENDSEVANESQSSLESPCNTSPVISTVKILNRDSITKKSPTFLEYLDTTNVRTIACPKPLTLDNTFKPKPKQSKLKLSLSPIQPPGKTDKVGNLQPTDLQLDRVPLSPVSLNTEELSEEVFSEQQQRASKCDDPPPPKRLSLGLSRSTSSSSQSSEKSSSSSSKISSYQKFSSPPQITQMLNNFKRNPNKPFIRHSNVKQPKNETPVVKDETQRRENRVENYEKLVQNKEKDAMRLKNKKEVDNNAEKIWMRIDDRTKDKTTENGCESYASFVDFVVDLTEDDEPRLPNFKKSSDVICTSPLLAHKPSLSRCKAAGLTRRPKVANKKKSNDLKQPTITLDKFALRKKIVVQ